MRMWGFVKHLLFKFAMVDNWMERFGIKAMASTCRLGACYSCSCTKKVTITQHWFVGYSI